MILGINLILVVVLAMVAGSLVPGSAVGPSLWAPGLMLGSLVCALAVPWLLHQIWPPNPFRARDLDEILDDPVRLGTASIGLFALTATMAIEPVLAFLVCGMTVWVTYNLLSRAFGNTGPTSGRGCPNCGFDMQGGTSETCTECGYTSVVLAYYRQQWIVARFDPNQHGGTDQSLRIVGARVHLLQYALRIPAGPGSVWAEKQREMTLLQIPEDLECYHKLQLNGERVVPFLPQNHGGRIRVYAPARLHETDAKLDELAWEPDIAALEMTRFDSITADNRAAMKRL